MTPEKLGSKFGELAQFLFDYLEKTLKIHITAEYRDGCVSYNFPDEKEEDYISVENKYITFRVKELKDWLFGFWLDYNEDLDIDDKPRGIYSFKWFAQVEKHINKFKPSDSVILEEDDFITEEDVENIWNYNCIRHAIKYIKKHKSLAWCRDVMWIDYNYNYMTMFGAFLRKCARQFRDWKEEQIKNYIVKKHLHLVKKYILPNLKGSYIYDIGENCSPRYEILMPLTSAKEQFGDDMRVGCYVLEKEDITDPEKYDIQIGKLENLDHKYIGWIVDAHEVDDTSIRVFDNTQKEEE